MKNLPTYKEFLNEDKHKGKPMNPMIVYHKSNPFFRDLIDKEGLKIMKGDSYIHQKIAVHQQYLDMLQGEYDSTYDDDIWEIDAKKIPNVKWYDDKETSYSAHITVVTYQNIPRNAIKLIYKGTGN